MIPQLLSQWPWIASAGAIFALVAATWRQCLGILNRIGDLIVCRVIVKDAAALSVMSFVWERGKRSPFGIRFFGGPKTYVHPNRRIEVVGYESITSDPVLLWHQGRPVVIARNTSNPSQQPNVGDYHSESLIRIWFIRGTFNPETLISECISLFNSIHQSKVKGGKSKTRRFTVRRVGGFSKQDDDRNKREVAGRPYSNEEQIEEQLKTKTVRLLNWKADDIGMQPESSPFNGYAFPKPVMSALSEIRTWLENEKWFRSKGIPWRRGWLLYGQPGSGKSTLVRSIAMEFDLPVYVLDLSGMTNDTLASAWQDIQQNAPAIALIEDIDAVFKGRENISAMNTTRDSLTFDCLLNTISGVGNSDGVFLFVTTNHIEHLDPAIGVPENGQSTRPGRIDRVIHLGLMDEPERRAVAEHILGDFPALIGETVRKGEGMTAAQFQHKCAQLALEKFWEGRK
jgi:hypothetical protein